MRSLERTNVPRRIRRFTSGPNASARDLDIISISPAGAFVRQLNDLQAGQPQPEGSFYCVMTSNFDPDTAQRNGTATEFPPSWFLRLGDKPVDELMGKPNDLVVDVESMSQIDTSVGDFVKDRFDFGTNGTVYHTNYFLQKGTAIELTDWLQLG